jgi:hypothetical protein
MFNFRFELFRDVTEILHMRFMGVFGGRSQGSGQKSSDLFRVHKDLRDFNRVVLQENAFFLFEAITDVFTLSFVKLEFS